METLNSLLESLPTCAWSHFPNSLQALPLLRNAFNCAGTGQGFLWCQLQLRPI
jgi:hypothetical protein